MGFVRALVLLFLGVAAFACSGPSASPPVAVTVPPAAASTVPRTSGAVKTEPVENVRRSRSVFAKKMARVKVGMTAEAARTILGEPDDMRTHRDPGGITASRTRHVWRFGTLGHLTFATLGQVHIDDDGKVQYVFGGKDAPPPKELLAERTLRRLLRLLDEVSSHRSQSYDPMDTIRAVNALQPLGKKVALATLAEYLRVRTTFEAPEGDGAFFVMRVLFELPPSGHMPPMMVGASSPPAPSNPKSIPRFPIALVDDIPFLVSLGYRLGGRAERPERHLAFFRDSGTLRSQPLRPPDHPLEVVDRLVGKSGSAFAVKAALDNDHGRVHIMNQGIRMLDSVYRVANNPMGSFFANYRPRPAWGNHLVAVRALDGRFDAALSLYTMPDGSRLPQATPPLYQRVIWELSVLGAQSATVIFERRSKSEVSVSVNVDMLAHKQIPTIRVRVLEGDVELRSFEPFAKLAGTTTTSTMGTQHGAYLALAEGREVEVEAVIAGKTMRSPILKP